MRGWVWWTFDDGTMRGSRRTAVPWLEHGFQPHDAGIWSGHSFDASDAVVWRDVGIPPGSAANQQHTGVTCEVARLRSNAGLQPPT